MTFRYWTDAELTELRACYTTPTGLLLGHLPIHDLAARLNRTYNAVIGMAMRLGLTRKKGMISDMSVSIRRMYRLGHSMKAIGRKLRISEFSVKRQLVAAGIEPRGEHALTDAERDEWRRSIKGTLHRQGYESLGDMTHDKWLGEAMARWPVATTRRQCDVLDVLAEGPATRVEIGRRLGIGPLRTLRLLQQLRALGAVLVVPNGNRRVGNRGSLPWTYSVWPGVERGKVVAERAGVAV